MKNNKIFALAMAFVMGALVALPAYAEELDKVELRNAINQEIQQVKTNPQKEVKNYLREHASDYRNGKQIDYFHPNSPYTSIDCEESKYCKQFIFMSGFIEQHKNNSLKTILNNGHEPRLWIKIDNKKVRNLFTQAILSNNKDAVDILAEKIGKNLVTDLYNALYNLLEQDPLAVRAYYNKEFEQREKELNTPITSKDISSAVINGDEIDFLVSYDLIDSSADKVNILLNAIYEIIDYRIAQGY